MTTTIYDSDPDGDGGFSIDITGAGTVWFFDHGNECSPATIDVDKLPQIYRAIGDYLDMGSRRRSLLYMLGAGTLVGYGVCYVVGLLVMGWWCR